MTPVSSIHVTIYFALVEIGSLRGLQNDVIHHSNIISFSMRFELLKIPFNSRLNMSHNKSIK